MLVTAVDIRLCTTDEAALIADLSRRTFYETFSQFNTPENMDKFMEEQFSTLQLMAEVDLPGNTFLLAYCNDEPVGYVRLRENNNPPELAGLQTLEIARIYVEQRMIGKGIGKTLMQHCIKIAREKGKHYVWLGVWEKNYSAIDFYRAWGFKKFGTHAFILGDDVQTDWLMIKKLDEDQD
jgi:ribosomal protein S18 acetylase RimI-like enzyme